MMPSGLLWGFVSDAIGRKNVLICILVFDTIFSILIGLAQNYMFLLIVKLISGFLWVHTVQNCKVSREYYLSNLSMFSQEFQFDSHTGNLCGRTTCQRVPCQCYDRNGHILGNRIHNFTTWVKSYSKIFQYRQIVVSWET